MIADSCTDRSSYIPGWLIKLKAFYILNCSADRMDDFVDQWADAQRHSGIKRFVLMLVQWIDENYAERIGLLTSYSDEFRSDLIQNLPRIRKQFILQ